MIPVTYFRSSSFNCHTNCPMQFMGEYILGWRGPSNIKADKGTIVHKILEIVALAKLAHQNKELFVLDEIGEWGLDKDEILTNDDINDIIEKVFGWYTSRVTAHNWSEADYKDCHKWTWKALTDYNGEFDPRNKFIVNAEQHFDQDISEPWAMYKYELDGRTIEGCLAIKGTMDQVNKIDDDTYEILDWKTGRRLNWGTGEIKEHAQLRKDPQLRIYHYAASKLFPNVKQVLLTIYFINDGGPFTICFNQADLAGTEAMLKKKFEEIKATDVPHQNVTWMCKKLCHMGKTTFEGTHVKALPAPYDGHITKRGEIMSKCEQLAYVTRNRSIESVIKNMSAPGHEIDKYKSPGSVE